MSHVSRSHEYVKVSLWILPAASPALQDDILGRSHTQRVAVDVEVVRSRAISDLHVGVGCIVGSYLIVFMHNFNLQVEAFNLGRYQGLLLL